MLFQIDYLIFIEERKRDFMREAEAMRLAQSCRKVNQPLLSERVAQFLGKHFSRISIDKEPLDMERERQEYERAYQIRIDWQRLPSAY